MHWLQHVPFEGLGSIAPWLAARGARVTGTRLFEDPVLPGVDELDWLIVMGGPMSANDDDRFPWLVDERALIAEAVATGKVVLGICLGAQLLARALGARVYANAEPEIGWFPVEAVGAGQGPLDLPADVFHWHGETFDLPRGAAHLARSAACAHQAFGVGPRVLGMQFHLEMTPEGARALTEASASDLRAAPWVQTAEQILADGAAFARINQLMDRVLDGLARVPVAAAPTG